MEQGSGAESLAYPFAEKHRMFAPANQSAFTLTLDGAPSELKVFEFQGSEAISQPYRFDLELVSEQPDLDLESLLHRQVYLGFDDHGHGVHGLVYRVAQAPATEGQCPSCSG